MKKLIYALAFFVSSSILFTSCAEEEVKPIDNGIGGGAPIYDKQW